MKKKLLALVAALLVFAMVVPAYGVDFVKSIEQKGLPEIIPQKNKDGDEVIYIGLDKDGKEVDPSQVSGLELVLTPLSEKEGAFSPQVTDDLTDAYKELKDSKTLDKLVPGFGDALKKFIEKNPEYKGLTAEDLIVEYVFDVALKDTSNNKYVTLGDAGLTKVMIKLKSTDILDLVLFRGTDGKWQVVDSEIKDGVMTLYLPSDGVISLLKESTGGGGKEPQKPSPQTGYTSNTGIFVAISLCAATALLVGGCVLADKKKR